MASKLGLFGNYRQDLENARVALADRKMDEGLSILGRYRDLLSVDIEYMILYARLVQAQGNYAEAEEILSKILAMDPSHAQAILDRADCLVLLGRRPEAFASLETAHAASPAVNALLGAYLALLLGEQGLPAAIAALRKEHLRRKPPRHLGPAIEKIRQKALSLHDLAELRQIDPEDLLQIESDAADDGYSLRRIYEAFESIGCNCELGFVQRKSGAEPLSLLRWTSISPEKLIDLLARNLEGYEKPEHYTLRGNFEREFYLHESEFDTQSHTGVNQSDISPEDFLHRMTRRQAFLKRKFLEDATQGQKIFVYKADTPLEEMQMVGIENELFRLGVRHCLFVMPTPHPLLAGRVQSDSHRRAIGYLSAVMPDIKYEEWNRIAITAYDHFVRKSPGE